MEKCSRQTVRQTVRQTQKCRFFVYFPVYSLHGYTPKVRQNAVLINKNYRNRKITRHIIRVKDTFKF